MKKEVLLGWLKHWSWELILLVLITFDVLGFLGFLPSSLELVDKLASWVLLGLLFYHLSITKLLFGQRLKKYDLLILVSYLLFVMKNLMTLLEDLIHHELVFKHFFELVVENGVYIELFSFYIAGLILLVIALILSLTTEIKNTGAMGLIHEVGRPPEEIFKRLERFVLVFVALNFFYLVVFNLIVEWLGFVADDTITVVSLILVIYLIFKHLQKIKVTNFLDKVADMADGFYEHVIDSIHTKRFYLLLIGLLIMHLITDVVVFILPLFIGSTEIQYLGHFEGQLSVFHYMFEIISSTIPVLDKFVFSSIYVLNLLAVLLLAVLPLILWYVLYTLKKEKFPLWFIVLFFVSVSVLVLVPAFSFEAIGEAGVAGVNLIVHDLSEDFSISIYLIIGVILTMAFLSFVVTHYYKKAAIFSMLLVFALLFSLYIYFFFSSIANYYISGIIGLFTVGHALLSAYFLLFLIIEIIFYVGGTLYFFYEMKQEFKYLN